MASRNLYDNFNLLIVRSSELQDPEIAVISDILNQHKVPLHVQNIEDELTEGEFIDREYTHIISNTCYFPLYKFTQEKLIPVVTSQFIHKINELKRQPSIRPFSPNPEHVLKDVTVCVGGLPDSDKEAIYGGVRALGGSFSETLNKFVTHLISLDLDEDCCIVVKSIEEPKINIVVPNWIDDCIKLRKKLNEQPYLLIEDKDQLNQNLKSNAKIVKEEQAKIHNEKILQGKVIFFASDLQINQSKTHVNIKLWSEQVGAQITKELVKANTYIGRYREGPEYLTAMKKNLTTASLYWIFWMQEHQRYISPYEKLLHHPWVRDGLPEMNDFVISSTNYTGDARQYVTKLVEALGGKFTTTLNKKNTHLIAASPVGKKYESALKWGTVKVVNHLWLEETYADWSLKPTTHPRYSYYPHHFKLAEIIGETPLKKNVLRSFYESGEIDQTTNLIEDSQDEEQVDLIASKENASIIDKARESQKDVVEEEPEEIKVDHLETDVNDENAQPVNPVTQAPLPNQDSPLLPVDSPIELQSAKATQQASIKLPNDSKSVLTPIKDTNEILQVDAKMKDATSATTSATPTPIRARSGRKAKDQAAEKLHANMEELNVFEKQVKSKDVPLLPAEIRERKKRTLADKVAREVKKARLSGTEDEFKANLSVEEQQILKELEAEPKASRKTKKESTPTPSASPVPTSRYNINAICTGWDSAFNRTETSLLSNLGIHLYKDLKSNINTIASPKMMRTEKFLSSLSYNIEYIIAPEFFKDVVAKYKANLQDSSQLPDVADYSLAKLNQQSVKETSNVGLETLLSRCQENYQNKTKIFQGLAFTILAKLPGGVETISKILKSHGAKDIKVLKSLKELKSLKNLSYTKNKGEKDSFIFVSNDKSFNDKLIELLKEEGEDYEVTGMIVEWDWVVGSVFNMEIDTNHVTYEF